jgi:AcrR family transcriptional regulator
MTRVKRRYRSPRRKQQAEATRRAILDAAIELFTSQGFAATSIREIAERADVSEQTVYNSFGDKIGLLVSAGTSYAESSAGQQEVAFLAALAAEPDPIERIRLVARSSRRIWEGGAAELERITLIPELTDPRLEEAARKSLEYKHANTRATCAILFPDGLRRPGLELDHIAAFATAIDSGVTVTTLRSLGWSMDDWEAWVVDLLTLFLDPHAIRRPTTA